MRRRDFAGSVITACRVYLGVLFDPHEKDRRLWVWDDPDDAQDILLWNPVYDPGAVFFRFPSGPGAVYESAVSF